MRTNIAVAFIATIAFALASCSSDSIDELFATGSSSGNGGGNGEPSSSSTTPSSSSTTPISNVSSCKVGRYDQCWEYPSGIWDIESVQEICMANEGILSASSCPAGYIDIDYNDYDDVTTYTYPVQFPANATQLIASYWMDDSINEIDGVVWYKFNAIAESTYLILWNDSYEGDDTKTVDVLVRAYSNGQELFREDSGYNSPQYITLDQSGTVYLRVTPYSGTGTFSIIYIPIGEPVG